MSAPSRNVLFRSVFKSPWAIRLWGVAMVVFVGWLDYITGFDVRFDLFYLLPVCMVTWFLSQWEGYLISVVAALVWVVSNGDDPQVGNNYFLAVTNTSTRLGFFLVVTALLSAWKRGRERLEDAVRARTAELTREIADHQRARASVRALATKLSQADDVHRRQLAHDIHDALGQLMYVARLNLESAALGLANRQSDPEAGAKVEQTLAIITELIRQTRTMVFDLYPATLDDLGLAAALRQHGEEAKRRIGVEVTVSENGPVGILPAEHRHLLFRAIRELINNAWRHGHAQAVVVALHWQPGALRVVVDDDGKGFNADAVMAAMPPQGLGLAGMRERIDGLGGSVQIESQPGEGSRVILEIPLSPQDLIGDAQPKSSSAA